MQIEFTEIVQIAKAAVAATAAAAASMHKSVQGIKNFIGGKNRTQMWRKYQLSAPASLCSHDHKHFVICLLFVFAIRFSFSFCFHFCRLFKT